ncbi:hypothetical protein [Streptomyces niveus]
MTIRSFAALCNGGIEGVVAEDRAGQDADGGVDDGARGQVHR